MPSFYSNSLYVWAVEKKWSLWNETVFYVYTKYTHKKEKSTQTNSLKLYLHNWTSRLSKGFFSLVLVCKDKSLLFNLMTKQGRHFVCNLKRLCFVSTLQQSKYKVINKDQWCNILEFSRSILPDLSNYDEDGACT